MKVILLRDVAKLGRRFEVKEVPAGYAHNFLIPKKLAVPATEEALRKLTVEEKKKSILSERHDSSFKSVLEALEATLLELRVPANEQGHLFKGIHATDIAKHMRNQGMQIEDSEIILVHPIKEVGDHTITLTSGQITGTCTIRISKQ